MEGAMTETLSPLDHDNKFHPGMLQNGNQMAHSYDNVPLVTEYFQKAPLCDCNVEALSSQDTSF